LGQSIRHHRRLSPALFAQRSLPGIEVADEEFGI
jgi:hypothetical protein